jgi:hypothetical protein
MSLLLDIRMLNGMKSTWPLPALLPVINSLEIYELHLTFFGFEFNLRRIMELVGEYAKYYGNWYIAKWVFREEIGE